MLLWSNPWVQPASAVCVGVGSGLFIDEVGKFITARNDYFTPLAAPIIYSAFLAVMGVAVLARRVPLDRLRSLAYTALVGLKDLADGPLRPHARAELLHNLEDLRATSTRPELAELATRLLPVVETAPTEVPHGRFRGVGVALARVEQALFPRWVHRLALIAASSMLGLLSLVGLIVFIALFSSDPATTVLVDDLAVGRGERPPALLAASVGEALVGSMLVVAACALLVGRDRAGTAIGRAGLMLGLAGVNVALGYLDAELVVVVVVVELMLLLLFERYRARFLRPRAD